MNLSFHSGPDHIWAFQDFLILQIIFEAFWMPRPLIWEQLGQNFSTALSLELMYNISIIHS